MKTIREWFNELPDGMMKEALKVCNCEDAPVESLSKAICQGFIWDKSPSGDSYWRGVYEGLLAVGK